MPRPTPFGPNLPPQLPVALWQTTYFTNANLAGQPVLSIQAGQSRTCSHHRLKPVSDTESPLKRTLAPSPLQRTFCIRRAFQRLVIQFAIALSIQVQTVDFNWGVASPAPAVPADHFSARFEQTVNLPAGFYTMRAQADDGIRVYLNNELIINEWHAGEPPIYRVGRQLAGPTTFRVGYYEAGDQASIHFTYDMMDSFPEWKVTFYNNISLQGAPIWIEPDTCNSVDAINHQWSLSSPVSDVASVNNWSARWVGSFRFESGNYLFWAEADDGVRLWLDGHLVIDAWRYQSGKTQNTLASVRVNIR